MKWFRIREFVGSLLENVKCHGCEQIYSTCRYQVPLFHLSQDFDNIAAQPRGTPGPA
jgi:hypothetical protein